MVRMLFFIFMSLPSLLFAQYTDDFTDASWSSRWGTHTGRFSYDRTLGALVYDAPGSNGASLSRASAAMDSAEWNVSVIFAPAVGEAGFFRFYLSSRSSLFTSGEEAFYVQCADGSGCVSLAYQKDGVERTLLRTSPVNVRSDGYTDVDIKVRRTCDGSWSLACVSGGVACDGGTAQFSASFVSVASGFRIRMSPDSQYLIAIRRVSVQGKARCGDAHNPEEPASRAAPRHSVVFSEIMADPSPAVALPEVEYVEVYNRSDSLVDLAGYRLFVGDSYGVVMSGTIAPGQYAVLCAAADSAAMSAYGKVLPVKNFRALVNDGKVVSLADDAGNVLTWMDYSDKWYRGDRFKRDGGWSLERHDVDNLRCDSSLWSPSVGLEGGTPCRANSVARRQPDTLPANLSNVGVVGDTLLLLMYDKEIDAGVNPVILVDDNPASDIFTSEPKRDMIKVRLSRRMLVDEIYTVEVSGVKDVSGLDVNDTMFYIGLPSLPESHDVVINELMFHPAGNAPKYLELYNRSEKIIDLSALYIAKYDDDGYIAGYTPVSSLPAMLFPGQYAVVTSDIAALRASYAVCDSALCVSADVSSLTADKGNVAVILRNGSVIDGVAYSAGWHHPLIDNDKGVSLERIDPEMLGESGGNWQSAASSAGYATPGCPNSHRYSPVENTGDDRPFWLAEETFTPDNDGFGDMLEIRYNLPSDGYVCSIGVYSPNGELLGWITKRELLPASGHILWDGSVGGRLLPVGVYVLLVEAIHPDGSMVTRKLVTVLSAR